MSAIDPASAIRPDWWTDDTYLHLAALEDGVLPGRGLLESEKNHPTLPVLANLINFMPLTASTVTTRTMTVMMTASGTFRRGLGPTMELSMFISCTVVRGPARWQGGPGSNQVVPLGGWLAGRGHGNAATP
ncbi:hypothetical protein ACFY2M_41850 [Streptomyces sp. NPDC001276]|uniref:hypothetical protein n=1 Tax=Streptomyces sp. NPDC001276 TaxID=3364555 RepID=UPI00369E07F8